jgi:multidrug transporter EmrE-like cation transporter
MGCWLVVLGRAEIGLVYPVFTGSVTFVVMLASAVLLGERLERRRVIGAVLMVAGILVASWE